MAYRDEPLEALHRLGAGAGFLLAIAMLAPIAALFAQGGAFVALSVSDLAALRFTLIQAALSAALSCLLAVPLARALARRVFPGRALLIGLLGAPFLLPTLVAVLGLLALFGRNGLLSDALGFLDLPPLRPYGLHGVVLAHVFLNLPLAARLLLQGWAAIPGERFRLAASLDFGPRETFRLIERPMLAELLPGIFAAIFLICLTSFAVALTLGGGPRATTVELLIYQTLIFEGEPARAALLALLQIGVTLLAALAAMHASLPFAMGAGLGRGVERWDARGVLPRTFDGAAILILGAFLLTPLALIAAKGAAALTALPVAVWIALARSLAVALLSAALTLSLSLTLALYIEKRRGRIGGKLAEAAGYLPLAASTLVMGVGFFLLFLPVVQVPAIGYGLLVAVNAVVSLPFALRAILPALRALEEGQGRLADSLGLGGLARLRLMLIPGLAPALGFSGGLAAAFAMGDLGILAAFVAPEGTTLPWEVHRLMAAYRMDDALGAGLLLMAASLGLFLAFDLVGRRHAAR